MTKLSQKSRRIIKSVRKSLLYLIFPLSILGIFCAVFALVYLREINLGVSLIPFCLASYAVTSVIVLFLNRTRPKESEFDSYSHHKKIIVLVVALTLAPFFLIFSPFFLGVPMVDALLNGQDVAREARVGSVSPHFKWGPCGGAFYLVNHPALLDSVCNSDDASFWRSVKTALEHADECRILVVYRQSALGTVVKGAIPFGPFDRANGLYPYCNKEFNQ